MATTCPQITKKLATTISGYQEATQDGQTLCISGNSKWEKSYGKYTYDTKEKKIMHRIRSLPLKPPMKLKLYLIEIILLNVS